MMILLFGELLLGKIVGKPLFAFFAVNNKTFWVASMTSCWCLKGKPNLFLCKVNYFSYMWVLHIELQQKKRHMLGMWKYSKLSWKEQKIFPELCQTGTEGPLQVICRDRNEDHSSVVLQEHFISLLLLSEYHPFTFLHLSTRRGMSDLVIFRRGAVRAHRMCFSHSVSSWQPVFSYLFLVGCATSSSGGLFLLFGCRCVITAWQLLVSKHFTWPGKQSCCMLCRAAAVESSAGAGACRRQHGSARCPASHQRGFPCHVRAFPSGTQQPVVAVGCWQCWYQPRGGTGVEVGCQRWLSPLVGGVISWIQHFTSCNVLNSDCSPYFFQFQL